MAGHSHWAGIKHRKGRADKQRSKIFSKLSKEITVAAKLGSKDADTNPRLRSAIQAARAANMPKDNIIRAINKSELNKDLNYSSIVYEGFGPEKIAIIVEALTDNKNRTASNIRTIFQKFGGNLGESGAVSHQFRRAGIIRVDKKKISDNRMNRRWRSRCRRRRWPRGRRRRRRPGSALRRRAPPRGNVAPSCGVLPSVSRGVAPRACPVSRRRPLLSRPRGRPVPA